MSGSARPCNIEIGRRTVKDRLFVTMLLENSQVHESVLRERLKAAHNFSEELNKTIQAALNRIVQSIRRGPPTVGNS